MEKEPYRPHLASRLRNLRIAHGYSQMDIAKALGVDRTAIAKYESGVAKPRVKSLERLAVLYNLPFNDLVKGGTEVVNIRPTKKVRGVESISGVTPDERALIVLLRMKGPEFNQSFYEWLKEMGRFFNPE